ncbi:carbonic anhydrase [Leadbetterella byssophila]|jgi:carbonic anhydrase|uniref:Carbonic anhydrase 2 n=1 Tax=Leadbetterella byssophila (strain DSM 17132 / JCM 16389 / KACC 11308 / NBRC 106382 / 4M15) TaxID=649349 RepID=E4RVA3_LEAB4|nr:carbonic anhydrase [Leadbetterella byssophila]ADQ18841.1 Carbonate dehydratase [Leadbetterella byssophila DSM 17132]
MEIAQIFKNNEEWIGKVLENDPTYFDRLAEGQEPKYLYIGCSDSRVTAETVMGAKPGEVFVHRNIANLAPNNDLNVLSVVVYAVKHLKVKHIIVCGHYNCGGIKAAMQPEDLGILNPWLRNIRDVVRIHQAELEAIPSEEERYKRLVELNVQEQCLNIVKMKEVQKAMQERGLRVHGWVFDLHSGRIIDQKLDMKEIADHLGDIYKLV